MKEIRFFHCEECGNVVALLVEGGGELVCCGVPMNELNANTVDAAVEKHVPVLNRDGNKLEVVVGSTEHPMEEAHYITFIAAQQGAKIQIANLKPGDPPKAKFDLEDGPVVVFEFCNLHGLWKAEA
ncbi:desulfoferrodoxin family protein [Microaceticoccus formicicus]|uniref:desulfoferrodoxin family protein n=1 Tax=Microaceticoccus formicicus TaxID=3118105 RepID=UPI003CD05286|nr:desulfoferrodoxin family protein [Peptoniphilaceae bacterium AMB_02]